MPALRTAYGISRGWIGSSKRYVLETLAELLRDAGQSDRLLELLRNPEWMAMRYEQAGFVYDGFARGSALGAARGVCVARSRSEGVPAFGPETSINSLAANYPAPLIVAAVKAGLWTVDRVLSTIARDSAMSHSKSRSAPHSVSSDLLAKSQEWSRIESSGSNASVR